MRLSTIRSALTSAASATTAVPCWSSWNTGMSSSSLSRSSISKQAGAAMSSRLMPPKTGAMRTTVSTISSAVGDVEADREGVDPGEVLEQQRLALHDRQGALGTDVAEAEHGGAVGDDGHRVLLDRVLVDEGRVLLDGGADPGHAGRVGHRQVVAVVDRHVGEDLDLAALVHLEGAVLDLDHLDAVDGADDADDLLDVRLGGAVDDALLVEGGPPHVEPAECGDVATGLADARWRAGRGCPDGCRGGPGGGSKRRRWGWP